MYKSKYRKRNDNVVLLVAVLLFISVGFALLNSNLNILGTTKVSSTRWDVHWNNLQVTDGSVTGSGVTTPATIKTGNTEVEFSITLNKPGEYYEFTVDAVNQGSLDAMINSITNKVYESNGTTEKTLPAYLNYTVTYDDGIALAQYHKLAANSTEKIKVRVEFKSDVTAEQLPSTAETTVFKFSANYIQADSNAIDKPTPNFSTNDWATIVSVIKSGNTSAYNVGDTKTVDMGDFGTHTLRIANKSTPSECSTTGFSQTACGFVLEFADIITEHNMNATDINVGGWPASSMREYVNDTIYNALPTELKNGIIDTTVVSGHGSTTGEENFTSTDKIYLLDAKEIYGTLFTDSYNTAKDSEKQLDYYNNLGVTTSDYSGVIKQKVNGSNSVWWLRSGYSRSNDFYIVTNFGGWYYNDSNKVYGVSPAFRVA